MHKLHTFSVGIVGSPDLVAARKVADFLGTKHHELTFTVEQGLDALSDLIYHIESYEQVGLHPTSRRQCARSIRQGCLGGEWTLAGPRISVMTPGSVAARVQAVAFVLIAAPACPCRVGRTFLTGHLNAHVMHQGISALQVRAAVPMYLLARRIKAMGFKVVLSGEGADEIFGGYLYFHKAPSPAEFHRSAILHTCPASGSTCGLLVHIRPLCTMSSISHWHHVAMLIVTIP